MDGFWCGFEDDGDGGVEAWLGRVSAMSAVFSYTVLLGIYGVLSLLNNVKQVWRKVGVLALLEYRPRRLWSSTSLAFHEILRHMPYHKVIGFLAANNCRLPATLTLRLIVWANIEAVRYWLNKEKMEILAWP